MSLGELEAWLAPYRELWTQHFDALGAQLDARARAPLSPTIPDSEEQP